MDLKIGVIRMVLFISNGIFACTGVAIIATSSVIYKEMRVYSEAGDFMASKYAGILITLMVVGSLVVLVSILGCYGTWRENQKILMAFAVMLFVIYVCEIVLSTLAFLRSNDIDIAVKNSMTKSFANYKFIPEKFHSYNTMQRNLKCCGVDSRTDYMLIFNNNSVPASCCYRYDGYMCRQSSDGNYVHQGGCFNRVRDFVAHSGVTLGSVTLCLAFSEVVAIVFALLLIILLFREEKKMGIHLKPGYKFEAVEMEPQESEIPTEPPAQDIEVLDFQPRQAIEGVELKSQDAVKPQLEVTEEAPKAQDSQDSSPKTMKAPDSSTREGIVATESPDQDVAVAKTPSVSIDDPWSPPKSVEVAGDLDIFTQTPKIEQD